MAKERDLQAGDVILDLTGTPLGYVAQDYPVNSICFAMPQIKSSDPYADDAALAQAFPTTICLYAADDGFAQIEVEGKWVWENRPDTVLIKAGFARAFC